jgi:hypothetical protein
MRSIRLLEGSDQLATDANSRKLRHMLGQASENLSRELETTRSELNLC